MENAEAVRALLVEDNPAHRTLFALRPLPPLPPLSDLPRADFTSGEDDSLDEAAMPPLAGRRPVRLPFPSTADRGRIEDQLAPVLDPYQVAPPSRIPVPGTGSAETEQFILLGGVVNSRFKEILGQVDVKARVERFGALVINIYQLAADNSETPFHRALKADAANLAESLPGIIDYYDVDLADAADAPIREHLFTHIPLIDQAINNNKQVFIYCGKGISRSASFVLGYLILAKNMTDIQANDYVLELRTTISPNFNFSVVLSNLGHENQTIIGDPRYGEISLSDKIARLNPPEHDPLVDGFPFRMPPSPIVAPVAVVDHHSSLIGADFFHASPFPADTHPAGSLEVVYHPGTNPFSRSMGSAPAGLDLPFIQGGEVESDDEGLARPPLPFFPRATSGYFLTLPGSLEEETIPGSGRRSRAPSR